MQCQLPTSSEASVCWMEDVVTRVQPDPHSVEDALRALSQAPQAMDVAKAVLERSRVPMAHFYATTTLQIVVLQRWDSLSVMERSTTREYVWRRIVEGSTGGHEMERYVFFQLTRTLAILWKRSWKGLATDEKDAWLSVLRALAESIGSRERFLASSIILTMVEEFASTKALHTSLPLEFHRSAQASFVEFGYIQMLTMAMKLLSDALGAIISAKCPPCTSLDLELSISAIEVINVLLSWEFSPSQAWQAPSRNDLLSLGPLLRPYIIRPDLLGSVFAAYNVVRLSEGGQLPHVLLQLVLQLASVTGDIFEDMSQKVAYGSFLLDGLNHMVSVCLPSGGAHTLLGLAPDAEDALKREWIGIAGVYSRLVSNYGLAGLSSFPCFGPFMEGVASLTLVLLQRAAAACSRSGADLEGDELMEEFTEFLHCWVLLINDDAMSTGAISCELKGDLKALSQRIYENYVISRLTMSRCVGARSAAEEERHDIEDIGHADIEEELVMISSLGRQSVTVLPALLDGVRRSLATTCAQIKSEVMACPAGGGCNVGAYLNNPSRDGQLEESRVAAELVGYLLADDDEGEVPLIPESLLEPLGLDDFSATVVVDLFKTIAHALDELASLLEQAAPEARILISPHLCQVLIWCVSRLSRTYLLPNASLYREGRGFFGDQSSPLTDTFAAGEASTSITDFLLKVVVVFLRNWPGEPSVCEDTLILLGSLVTPTVAPVSTHLPRWIDSVLPLLHDNRLSLGDASELTRQVVRGTLYGKGEHASFHRIATHLQTRFASLVAHVKSLTAADRQNPSVIYQAESCTCLYSGLVRGGGGRALWHCGIFHR